YGMMTGMLHQLLPKKPASLYVALLSSMVLGRLVWGAVRFAMLLAGTKFSWELFVSGAFVNALPGIALQLALVPIIVIALQKAGLISCERR
ncbi:MAG TPA: ECF transporter S component, partial [Bacillota bacterium]|nr:ECF transporter S component [Bacillota bacterium]